MSSKVTACPSCGKKNRVPASATGTPRCAVCTAPLPWVVEVGDGSWGEVTEQATVPVVADFWAEWCGPCRMVSPVLEQLATEYAGRIKVVKVNVDQSPALSQRFKVQSIPMLGVFDGGRMVSQQVGAAGIDHMRRWLDSALAAL